LAWFHEAKFGMFIHWGIYAVPAGEWKGATDYGEWIHQSANIAGEEYEKFATRFNPVQFDAAEWVGLAKDASMRYMVITAKHHDGFCMYDTALTNYNIVKTTPYGRDPMKGLAHECEKAGITFCFYYSVKDWHHPEYPTLYTRRRKLHPDGFHGHPNPGADYTKYQAYMKGQLRELLTNYGPIGIVWFDWSGEGPAEHPEGAREIVNMIHELQPECLINNRLGGFGADYGTPEQHIPAGRQAAPFEVCMTLNRHWGYNSKDHDWKDVPTVIRSLVDIAGKGGNYLLNVGPTAAGVIPSESADILRGVGKWVRTNGESIYSATPHGPDLRPDSEIGGVTARPGCYYLHMFKRPTDGRVFLIDFKKRFKRSYFLADKAQTPLAADVYRRSLLVYLPEAMPDPVDSVVVVEYEEP